MSQTNGELSERELDILQLLVTGATNQQIARALVISPNTVKVHLRNIFGKMGVESRTEATLRAIQQGLVAVEGAPAPAIVEAQPAPESSSRPTLTLRPATLGQRVLLFAGLIAAVVGAFFLPGRLQPRAAQANPFLDQTADNATAPESGTSRWSTRAVLPAARARLAVVAFQERILAIGGVSGGLVTDLVDEYDPGQDAWASRAAMPVAAANIGAVVLGERIYVPGGYGRDGRAMTALQVYDPAADKWSDAAALPRPLCAYAIAAYGGKVYLFGGWDGQSYSRATWIYDPAVDRWREGAPMPARTGRGFAAAAVAGDRILVLGGYDGAEQADAFQYDPADDTWAELPPLSAPRGGAAAVAVGSSVYVVGGGWNSYLAYSERLDLRTLTWSRFETPILGQWRNLGAAASGDRIYAVGGWSNEDLNTNREYQTVFRIMLPRP